MPGVLIVDDEELIRFSFSKALRNEGFSVENAETGRGAIEKIAQGKYDLAVVDLHLGDIDGIDVVRSLKDISPDTRIIVITSVVTDDLKERVFGEGVDDIYEKPFDTYEVVSCIRNCLTKRGSSSVQESRYSRRRPYEQDVAFSLCFLEGNEVRTLPLKGSGVDISQTGVCLKVDYLLKPGHLLEFHEGIEGKTGMVTWTMIADDNSCKAGVKFIDTGPWMDQPS